MSMDNLQDYEVVDGVKWLIYGVICEHDDYFLCKHRWDFINNHFNNRERLVLQDKITGSAELFPVNTKTGKRKHIFTWNGNYFICNLCGFNLVGGHFPKPMEDYHPCLED